MGFRFRKSVRFGPVRINSKSISVGVRGASLNFSQRGVRGTVGIPGTGLSYSEMIAKAPAKPRATRSNPQPIQQQEPALPTEPQVREWLGTHITCRESYNEVIAAAMAIRPDYSEDADRVEAMKSATIAKAKAMRAESERVIAWCEEFLQAYEAAMQRNATAQPVSDTRKNFRQLEEETLAKAASLGIKAPRKPRFRLWIAVGLLGAPILLPTLLVALYSVPRRLFYRCDIENLARWIEDGDH